MSGEPIRVILLVENCAEEASSLRSTFQHRSAPKTEVIHARSMADAETLLARRAVGIILLDLQLPDARGLGCSTTCTCRCTPRSSGGPGDR